MDSNSIDPPVILRTVAGCRVGMRGGPGVEHEHVGWAERDDRLIYHESANGYAHVSIEGSAPERCGWVYEAVLVREA